MDPNRNPSHMGDAATCSQNDDKHKSSRHARTLGLCLGDLAVEIVFPACSFIRLKKRYLSRNKDTMSKGLVGGEVIRGEHGMWGGWWELIAGSQAEGLAVDCGWGHGKTDRDTMWLRGGGMVVGVTDPAEGINLMYKAEDCPPAYTRLQVIHKNKLLGAIERWRRNSAVPAIDCVSDEDRSGRWWLKSNKLLNAMRPPLTDNIQGPAAAWGPDRLNEFVTCLVCSKPHPDMNAYGNRTRRNWPSQSQIQDLLTLPMLLVCVGPQRYPDTDLLFRVSWSPHEMMLLTDLVLWAKQGYICFKVILKVVLASYRRQGENDGRSRLGSYHMKTVFLRYLEEQPPQPNGSPYQLALNLCRDLQGYLKCRKLPHYFLPSCNLLQTVPVLECQYAISAVAQVLRNPLAAIFCSPYDPEKIFGSLYTGDDLLRCIREVSMQPTCESTWGNLQPLLWDLDRHRKGKLDSLERVSGRPELVCLSYYLHQLREHYLLSNQNRLRLRLRHNLFNLSRLQ